MFQFVPTGTFQRAWLLCIVLSNVYIHRHILPEPSSLPEMGFLMSRNHEFSSRLFHQPNDKWCTSQLFHFCIIVSPSSRKIMNIYEQWVDFNKTLCHGLPPSWLFSVMSFSAYLAHASPLPLWGTCGDSFLCLVEVRVDMSTALLSLARKLISPKKFITLVKHVSPLVNPCCCSCFLSCPASAWKCLLRLTNHFPKEYRLTSL